MFRSFLLGSTAALSALALAITGCSATLAANRSQVEEAIAASLAPQLPSQIENVTCPGDLRGEIGATLQCTMVVNDREHKVDLTVTSIEETRVNFTVEVVA